MQFKRLVVYLEEVGEAASALKYKNYVTALAKPGSLGLGPFGSN